MVVPYDVHDNSFTGKAYLPQTTDAGDLTSFTGGHGSYTIAAGDLAAKVDFLRGGELRIQADPSGGMRQSLERGAEEQFFGGGEQNGSLSHRGQTMYVANNFNWNEGGYNNSQPFYLSSAGYGVYRNTFAPGVYNFGPSVQTGEQERRFDAYYFVGDAKRVIGDYTSLVGKPFMPPIYGLEPGDSDCYLHNANQGERHTLDSLQIADNYVENQMPLGWMLVNDGYGCGYENLAETAQGLHDRHAQLGLWTQDGLDQLADQVKAGQRVAKLDVAWVGNGYGMALNACDTAKKGIEDNSDARGFVWLPVSWAGAQRCGVMWSGDQSLSWDYIRWQIPTYAGATMSGIAYDTGDVGSIYRHDPQMFARDLQSKIFNPAIMTMDGWARDVATGQKAPHQQPWAYGEPYTSINRKYLQLRERLLPYLYTLSAEATKSGVGSVRPLWLEYPDDPNTLGADAKYEYLSGDDFLVAPVYQDSDTRNGIYLPKGTWTDYWTGKTYHGPSVVNGYHAPLDTLPLFVRSGAIVPMWPQGTTSWQTRDKGELDWDVYPSGHSAYTLYEDDGVTRQYAAGGSATQHLTSDADRHGVRIEVGASRGDYAGKPDTRRYLFTVHGQPEPKRVSAGGPPLRQVDSAEALAAADSGWFRDPATGVVSIKTTPVPLSQEFTVTLRQ